jgi:hypothetical protein
MWPHIEAELGALIVRREILSTAQWEAILKRVLVHIIDEAVAAARTVCVGRSYWPSVEKACAKCRAAIASADSKAAAEAAARAARAAKTAGTAIAAAGTATALVAEAAVWGAVMAATAAAAEAEAARAVGKVAWAAVVVDAARAAGIALADEPAAYQRLFAFVLDQIEAELGSL